MTGAIATPSLSSLVERASARAWRRAVAEAEAADRCGLCAAPVPDEHRHVIDLERGELLCACRACGLLFDRPAAGDGGRLWRLVPDRCLDLGDLALDDLGWCSLGLPVDLAFFVRSGASERVRAFYPSPAGVTECTLELASWSAVEDADPRLAQAQDDVEAVLVDRTRGHRRALLVGVDECYRLAALVRVHWRGFTGGDRVWQEIDGFFDGLHARAQRCQ